ncbi:MAG: histidinol dehydrogenase [Acidimicrobiia bacterium]|nr:histidinol dehydrogenase [Acidimicrobiia bacterium]
MTLRRIDLDNLPFTERRRIVTRSAVPDPAVRAAARSIVDDVAKRGDAAVTDYNRQFGGGLADGSTLLEADLIEKAAAALDPELREALETAAAAIRATHERQRPTEDRSEPTPGVVVRRRWAPVRRVAVYVPGGQAAYPSSVLMGVIPAQVAGVPEIAVITPAGADGQLNSAMLGAIGLLGIDEVYVAGGAQAIGAAAHGTGTFPAVDKIVGPGNAWVTAAKLEVFGTVSIDLPAGPSEAIVVADGSADPAVVAADLLCQAEHGGDSPVMLVTWDAELADSVAREVQESLPTYERADILEASLTEHGAIVVAGTRQAALQFCDDFAPEHIGFHTDTAAADADAVISAGSVFVGPHTPHSAADYATGANHVLPTGGLARAHGPLSVEDFGSWRQQQEITADGLAALGPVITTIARAEGLSAHARAVTIRLESREGLA